MKSRIVLSEAESSQQCMKFENKLNLIVENEVDC